MSFCRELPRDLVSARYPVIWPRMFRQPVQEAIQGILAVSMFAAFVWRSKDSTLLHLHARQAIAWPCALQPWTPRQAKQYSRFLLRFLKCGGTCHTPMQTCFGKRDHVAKLVTASQQASLKGLRLTQKQEKKLAGQSAVLRTSKAHRMQTVRLNFLSTRRSWSGASCWVKSFQSRW